MFGRRASGPGPDPIDIRDRHGSVLALDAIEAHRGGRLALRDVTFAIEPGTLTAVVGPNGAGKSSLFGALSGRLPASTKGSASDVRGARGRGAPEHGRSTGSCPVDRRRRRPASAATRIEGCLRTDAGPWTVRLVEDALAATDMLDLRRRPINELSGGQRQRALVAQGLAQRAPILLLDEPTAGLDRRSQRQLLDILAGRGRARGTTVLFATHDLDEAAKADNLIVMACECVCCAPPVTAMADPAVTALFGPAPRWAWNDAAMGPDPSPAAPTVA